MIVQISSGQGPAECELAVVKLFNSLKNEHEDIELIQKHEAKTDGCCTSIMFTTEDDLSELEGTVQWICESPFRPHHIRTKAHRFADEFDFTTVINTVPVQRSARCVILTLI